MKQIKVSEATNIQLDWLVARVSTEKGAVYCHERLYLLNSMGHKLVAAYSPSTDWSQMGPIIHREKIGFQETEPDVYAAWSGTCIEYASWPATASYAEGSTPLIAAARCYCCAKLGGDVVEVPEELCQQRSS